MPQVTSSLELLLQEAIAEVKKNKGNMTTVGHSSWSDEDEAANVGDDDGGSSDRKDDSEAEG